MNPIAKFFLFIVLVFSVVSTLTFLIGMDVGREQAYVNAQKLERSAEKDSVESPGITGYDVLEIVGRFSTDKFQGNGTTGFIVKAGEATDFIDVDDIVGEVTKDTKYLLRIHHGYDKVVKPLVSNPILPPESQP